ncbi:MAG: hypothetical protein J1F20_02375 [Muribaculaceae bacterium]|nr:hypothetical protein [Muribaculaceae bacterium]
MAHNNDNEKKDSKWGTYWVAGFIVAIICVGILIYIGWFDNKTHVDSPNGDNVTATYEIDTPQPQAPGENDWNNPDESSLQEIIVDHAAGTDTVPMPQ